jgi:hypothetical protein
MKDRDPFFEFVKARDRLQITLGSSFARAITFIATLYVSTFGGHPFSQPLAKAMKVILSTAEAMRR